MFDETPRKESAPILDDVPLLGSGSRTAIAMALLGFGTSLAENALLGFGGMTTPKIVNDSSTCIPLKQKVFNLGAQSQVS